MPYNDTRSNKCYGVLNTDDLFPPSFQYLTYPQRSTRGDAMPTGKRVNDRARVKATINGERETNVSHNIHDSCGDIDTGGIMTVNAPSSSRATMASTSYCPLNAPYSQRQRHQHSVSALADYEQSTAAMVSLQ